VAKAQGSSAEAAAAAVLVVASPGLVVPTTAVVAVSAACVLSADDVSVLPVSLAHDARTNINANVGRTLDRISPPFLTQDEPIGSVLEQV
jgi:hypothetical protein